MKFVVCDLLSFKSQSTKKHLFHAFLGTNGKQLRLALPFLDMTIGQAGPRTPVIELTFGGADTPSYALTTWEDYQSLRGSPDA